MSKDIKKKYLVLIKDFKSEKGNKGEVKSALKAMNSNNVTILEELNELGVVVIETTEKFAEKIAKSKFVESIEADNTFVLQKIEEPEEDSIKARSVETSSTGVVKQWKDDATEYKNFWNAGYHGQNIRVAVLDTGYTPHPDLEGQVIEALDAGGDSGHAGDVSNHGTPAMGIIGAKIGTKYEGYAPRCKMSSIKIYSDNGYGSTHAFTSGIDYVLNNRHKYDVVMFNVQDTQDSTIYYRAIKLLRQYGLIVTVAGGNYGGQSNASMVCPAFPARYTEAIATGAIEPNMSHASYTCGSNNGAINFGVTTNLYATSATGDYMFFNGTSCATPSSAGMFTLLKSAYPHFGVIPLHALMKKGAKTDFPTYDRFYFGDGFMRLTANMLPNAVFRTYNGTFPNSSALGDFTYSNGIYNFDASGGYGSSAIGLPIKSTSPQTLNFEIMSTSSVSQVQVYLNGVLNQTFSASANYQVKNLSLPVGNNSVEIRFSNPYDSQTNNNYSIRNINLVSSTGETPIAPATPTLSVVSVNEKNATIRVTVPNTSATFNEIELDYGWVAGSQNNNVIVPSARSYDVVVSVPDFATTYSLNARVINGNAPSGWSSSVSFTSQNAPLTFVMPEVQVLSANGKNITVRVSQPSTSSPFDQIMIDGWWTVNGSDFRQVLTLPELKHSHDFVITVPEFNTAYTAFFTVAKGSMRSNTRAISIQSGGGTGVVAPVTPTLSLLSVNGLTATIRATVPSTSTMFNKLTLDYSWVSGTSDNVVTMSDTRTYDFTVTAPNYNTQYQVSALVHNGNVSSGWSSALTFTTGSNNTVIAPERPTLSLVSVNGKNVTVRATVPNTSTTFNKLQFDYYWSDFEDATVTMSNTRSYDFTFTAPQFNTNYQIDVKAYNGDMSSSWSNALSFTTGADNTVVSPANPTLSVVSVSGKVVTLRATVPSTSAPFNKLSVDHRWVDGAYEIIAMPSTRSYDFTFTAPQFNTTYQTDVMAYNGDMSSSWSNVLSYTTGTETATKPATPTLTLVSVNGKTVTLRATVPSDSAPFDRISIDHRWVSGAYENTNIGATRTYDFTFTAPEFNTTYQTDVLVYSSNVASSWSNTLSYTTGSSGGGTGDIMVIEDFTDNAFNFNFVGTWYRDSTNNALRSAVIDHNGTSATAFTVDAGANGASLNIQYKVSSEQGWDFLSIYIDGTRHVYDSGVTGYKELALELSSGVHTITFGYSKDGSASAGEDAGFVKRIAIYRY